MTPQVRKFALTTHVTCAVGRFGAVAAFLCLAITGLTSQDDAVARAAYVFSDMIGFGWFVILALELRRAGNGIVQSLGTQWACFGITGSSRSTC